MDSCHTLGHIKAEEGGLPFTVAEGNSPVLQCPDSCGRLSPETLISRAVMTESEWELCGGAPLGALWRVTMPVGWSGAGGGGGGGSALERAGDTVGAENLSSGPFSADQVSAPHARVYIASGNKLWGNLILLEAAGWLSSHPGSPVASHQATVSPLLRVCITSSTVLNHPSLTSCPPPVWSLSSNAQVSQTPPIKPYDDSPVGLVWSRKRIAWREPLPGPGVCGMPWRKTGGHRHFWEDDTATSVTPLHLCM